MGSENVTWHPGRLARAERWDVLQCRGGVVWITGLPASGKSSLATTLEERIVRLGVAAYLLDGDNLRHGINSDLGYDAASRSENVRRAAEVARLLADSGAIAVVSLISPYAADRAAARAIAERDGLAFLEVFVDTPLAECERRDPKGLYARARRGELECFTGVGDPYEPPAAPDVRVETLTTPIDQAAAAVQLQLLERGLLGRAFGGGSQPAPGIELRRPG
jgi:adenylyl-sulfate kinase